jgi:hypothetical protein
MYEALEQRTTVLCAGVLLAIVVLGKMFGGSLFGLIFLGACIASGLFLWMKEVVRSGRTHEWASEQERGKMVCYASNDCQVQS